MLIVLKKYTCFKENYFSLKLFLIFSFKIDSIILDLDLNWAKIPDPSGSKFNVFGSTTLVEIMLDIVASV